MANKEGKMAKYDAKEIAEDAVAVFKMIDSDMNLPEWLEAKITKSADYMNSVKDYLTHHMKENKKDDDDEKWSGIGYDSFESVDESDLGLTYKKGKTVKVKHKTSGKSLVIIDKPNVRKEYEKIGYYAEGTCGYGEDGKIGNKPAGPDLMKKKRKLMKGYLKENKLQKIALDIISDLNKKFPKYNAKKISDFNKVVKYFKSKMPKVSNIKLGQIALDYHTYREGDMGVKIPTIKQMAKTLKKIGMKTEAKLSDKELVKYALYIRKYKPGLWKHMKKNPDMKKLIKKHKLDENLRKWFSDKWVNIGKKDKSGKHPPCGTSGKKRGYAKCVPASKAAGMSKKQKASATRRKRAAQNKAGRGGTASTRGGGKKPIRVSTKPKK
jgi:hypothetical protein|tara:strand:+ start:2828 stop:3967 length:1140 start_codon:yes stop_codon:yes gene_type:complete